jgi:hypothetical protein
MRLCALILMTVVLSGDLAGDETRFVDARLEAVVREHLGQKDGPLPAEGLTGIRNLDIRGLEVESLDGIQALTSLRVFRASNNRITDLTPLAGMTGLIRIDITDNLVTDVSPLAGLTRLRILKLDRNRIREVGPISGLSQLARMTVEGNPLGASLDLLALYKDLRRFELDESAVVDVEDMTLWKDVASFHFTKGTFYLAQPHLAGEDSVRTGALFVGKGSVEVEPSTRVEREQLARFRDSERLSENFEVLFLRFTDSSLTDLLRDLPAVSRKIPTRVRREASYAQNYTAGDDDLFLSMVEDLVSETADGLFYAHIGKRMSTSAGYLPRPDFFIFAPREVEEVRLDVRRPSTGRDYLRQTICQFHRQEDYAANVDLTDENKAALVPKHYEGQFDVAQDGNVSGQVALDLEVVAAKVHVCKFWLHPALEISSITCAGKDVKFDTRRSTSNVVVFLDPPAFIGSTDRLELNYAGKVLTRENGTFYMHSSGSGIRVFPGARGRPST